MSKDTKLIQVPRVSVSRSRTISLGRFGLDYEKEEIFISLQADLETGKEADELLAKTAALLDREVEEIEAAYSAAYKPKKSK